MQPYLDTLRTIRHRGRVKKNRTGVDARTIIGPSMTFHMDDGFPLGTYRPIFFRGITGENIWFIDGKCNNEDLLAMGIKIWNQWALPEDVTRTIARELPDVVNDLVEIRRKEQEEKGEEVTYNFQDAVKELTEADRTDMDAGLPVMGKELGAQTAEELMGGHKILREAGIKLTKEQIVWPKGYLGPIYGKLWRGWISHTGERIDQLSNIMSKLASENPKLRYSRANIITSFNPAVLPDETVSAQENIQNGRQALAACHTMFQLIAEPLTEQERIDLLTQKITSGDFEYTGPTESMGEHLDAQNIPKDQLSLVLFQRSADFPVGVPFNIAGYALLLHMIAKQLNMKPYQFTHHFGDAHIYEDQLEGVDELLARADSTELPPLPKLWLNPEVKSISDYTLDDVKIIGYEPLQPQIKFPVAV